jgi:hypothetical protein
MTTTAHASLACLSVFILLGRDARAAEANPDPAPAKTVSAAPAVAPPEKTLSFGVGVRVGGGIQTTTAQTASDSLGIQSLDVRPYISGQVHPLLKFEGNLDLNNVDDSRIHVLSAVAKFEPDDLFNVWFGRFLPPSDRANLSGPYYQNAWNFPTDVNAYPSIFAGRADGGAVWGQLEKGRFKYMAGIFTLGNNTPISQGIYAARLVYNFLDPEPGYYNSSTYYGSKQILAVGGAVQYQRNGIATATGKQDLLGFNFDALFERPLLGGDALSLEGAYYDFEQGNQGQSFFVLASYLVGEKLGIGKIQPMVRFQELMPTGGGASTRVLDGGLNYILDGHNARLAFAVQHRDLPASASTTSFQLGVQIQE